MYYEPAQTYRSAWALFGAFAAGFVADLALGHGSKHIWAWLVAVVLVVGVDVLVTRAARTMRSITVTPHGAARRRERRAARVDHRRGRPGGSVAAGVGPERRPGPAARHAGAGPALADGAVLVVPTRHPDRLAAALHVSHEAPDVRLAEPDDLVELPEIDRRAETLFRVAGFQLPEITIPVDAMHDALVIFVAGRPAVGFVWVSEVDGVAYIEELAVIPGRMRQGLGTALLESACDWAAAAGYPAITLITYADVPWNAPFYATRGFTVVDDITPGLAALREKERAVGLDAVGTRVVMRRDLTL